MVPVIQLGNRQMSDLVQVLKLPPETVSKFVNSLAASKDPLLSSRQLEHLLEAAAPSQKELAPVLVRVILGLAALHKQSGLSIDEIRSGLLESLKTTSPESEGTGVQTLDALDQVLRVVLHNKVDVLTKCLELSYDFSNLLSSSRLITDIRPVFDSAASRIEAGVVTFTLRLNFTEGGADKTLNFALDEKDVRELQSQCDRALKKASLLVDALGEVMALRIAGQKEA
jgi:hypothetical protein